MRLQNLSYLVAFLSIAFFTISCSKTSTETLNEMVSPEAVTKYSGVFMGRQNQSVSGEALIVLENGKYALKLMNFKSDNGPDLKVYLSKESTPSSHISLGDLKSTNGNQVYEISGMPDLKQYRYALIHCERFNHLFGSAELK
jgi:hypothetical protein